MAQNAIEQIRSQEIRTHAWWHVLATVTDENNALIEQVRDIFMAIVISVVLTIIAMVPIVFIVFELVELQSKGSGQVAIWH